MIGIDWKATVADTAQILRENRISGAPVVKPDGTVYAFIGIVLEQDVTGIVGSWHYAQAITLCVCVFVCVFVCVCVCVCV